jgi:hypothetical protein
MLYEEDDRKPVWIVIYRKEIPGRKPKILAAMSGAKDRETVIGMAKASVTDPGYRLVFCEPLMKLFHMANFGLQLDD